MPLLDLMHKLYKNDKLTIDICDSIDVIVDKLVTEIEDAKAQHILDSATWFLKQKEKELQIENDTDDYELRRSRIFSKNIANGKSSVNCIKEIANKFNLNADVTVGNLVVNIIFLDPTEDDINNIRYAAHEIDCVIPAHLGIRFGQRFTNKANIYAGVLPVVKQRIIASEHNYLQDENNLMLTDEAGNILFENV